MSTRSAVLLAALSLLAVACSGAATDADARSPIPPVAGAEGETAPPDVRDLRVSSEPWSTDFSRAGVPLGEITGGGPPKDGIPAIDAPRHESVSAARTWLDGSSPVVALELHGMARAYPIAILIWHEIVNDTLGGIPVAVTFCPLCHTALVFERTVGGVLHDFGTTGNLRFSDLVMYDRQTESWWQQATGEAIVGTLTGTRLTFVPAQMISLDDFAGTWPDGDVLSRETGFVRSYGQNPYPGYDRADEFPFLFVGTIDGRIAPKERVVTVGAGTEGMAFAYTDLAEVGVASAEVAGQPLVVFWAPGTVSALDDRTIDAGRDAGATGVFRPVVAGRVLEFRRTGPAGSPITDLETGSTWSVTGRSLAGPLAGTQLEPVVHGDHFWFAWAAFTPETRIWSP